LTLIGKEDSKYKHSFASTDKAANNFRMSFFIILQNSRKTNI